MDLPMQFYVCARDQAQPIGPLSLSAAVSIVRATAMAQRAKGSLVWATREGKLFVKETGCELDALWVTDEQGRIIDVAAIAEFGTLAQQISQGITGQAEMQIRSKQH
jgi:hypothetical protein